MLITELKKKSKRKVSTHVFPAECGFTAFTKDVGNRMKSGQQDPLFGRSTADVHSRVEEQQRGQRKETKKTKKKRKRKREKKRQKVVDGWWWSINIESEFGLESKNNHDNQINWETSFFEVDGKLMRWIWRDFKWLQNGPEKVGLESEVMQFESKQHGRNVFICNDRLCTRSIEMMKRYEKWLMKAIL